MTKQKRCSIPPEVQALQRRQRQIELRLRFVESKLGIMSPKIIEELEVQDDVRST